MSIATAQLEQLSIPLPCSVDWASMTGDEKVRFCRQCRQQVYNLSQMTRGEAEQLLTRNSVATEDGDAPPRLCVRFYRRPDGTVTTRDCVAVRQALRNGVRVLVAAAAGAVLLVLACFGLAPKADGAANSAWNRLTEMEPLRTIFGGPQYTVMGSVCVPVQSPPAPMDNAASSE